MINGGREVVEMREAEAVAELRVSGHLKHSLSHKCSFQRSENSCTCAIFNMAIKLCSGATVSSSGVLSAVILSIKGFGSVILQLYTCIRHSRDTEQ